MKRKELLLLAAEVHRRSSGPAWPSPTGLQDLRIRNAKTPGGFVPPGASDRRICKVSLDSTLSGRSELHCEAHVSGPAPRSLRSNRTTKITFRGKVSVSRSTCRAACRRSDLLVVWLEPGTTWPRWAGC